MPKYINVSAQTSYDVIGERKLARRGILIHTDEGAGALGWLQGGSAKSDNPVSADFWIDRLGNVYQITPPGYFAWHSGRARLGLYQEADGSINQGFYGIELQNWGEKNQRVTNLQYISLAWLCRVLMTYNPIPYYFMESHAQAALPPGRKHDPSGFDWVIFTRELINPSPEWSGYVLTEELP